MLCAISEETPQEPVVSIKSGHVFEKRLIEKHIKSTGACPVTREPLALDDLMPLRVKAPFKPRPATLSSVPALLQTMQNEWDAVMLETYEVKQQLIETRKNLAQALYENDAAFRVIARLIKERDDAKHMLLQVRGAAPVPAPVQASAMIRESQSEPMQGVEVEVDERDEGGMTPTVLKKLEDAHTALSKGRKKRVKTRIGQVVTIQSFLGSFFIFGL
jgi:pre-mRNA-processing factor 19